jgi:S-adenosylmethionine-diacylglycerol 3-amino-3-carboxypropyl transferase
VYTTTREHAIWHRVHHRVFNALYNRSLLYNTCWEDPELDRVALELDGDDEVLVITSAGCNALDYALDAPRAIHAVDANPRQTALLELKLAGIQALDHDDFFQIFGRGRHLEMRALYRYELRPRLSEASQHIWDKNWTWFTHSRGQRSFYYHGLSGKLARGLTLFLRSRKKLWQAIEEMMTCGDLEQQRALYEAEIHPRLINKPLRWTLNRQFTMSMLGVPYPQREAVKREHEDGVAGFVRSCLQYVCTQLRFDQNYFWTLYLRGHYTPRCCPNYLTDRGFHALKSGLVDRVHPYTTTVTDFLQDQDNGADPSRLILLDHMDWMGHSFPEALQLEWDAIAERARPGSRILFRSGATDPAFLDSTRLNGPGGGKSLRDALVYHPEMAQDLHRRDRVHTYASFFIADLPS